MEAWMNHMPYEEDDVKPWMEEQPEVPGRTPRSAEGEGDEEQRRMPHEEPGKTPGSAEGDEPERRAPPCHS